MRLYWILILLSTSLSSCSLPFIAKEAQVVEEVIQDVIELEDQQKPSETPAQPAVKPVTVYAQLPGSTNAL